MEIKRLPLHDIHTALNAKLVPYAGFAMPVWYSSGIAEHMAVREGVGVFDVSHMGEFILKGPEALDLIQRITTNDASKLICGQAQYSCMPNEQGGIIDDLIVYKVDEEEYLLVVNASNIDRDWKWIIHHNTQGVDIKNGSDSICLFAVQGPKAVGVLQQLTTVDLSTVKYYHFVQGTLANVPQVIMSNTGYTGAGGFEIYVPKNKAVAVWEALFEAGKTAGIKPIGLGARDTLRLEKGYCLHGNDIDDTTSPLEAGLSWIVKFTKTFTYCNEFKKQKEEGVKKKLVGFKMIDKGIPRHHYKIKNKQGEVIGRVTSGAISPLLNTGIGLGYVTPENSNPGTDLLIAIRDRDLRASVQRLPFV